MQAKIVEYSEVNRDPKIKHYQPVSGEDPIVKELVLSNEQVNHIMAYLTGLESERKANSIFISDLKDNGEVLHGPHCTLTIPLEYGLRGINNAQEAQKLDILKYVYAGNNQKVKDLTGADSGKRPSDFLVIPENVKNQLINACKLLADA